MAIKDYLKEYLVKIGYDIDSSPLESLDKQVQSFFKKASGNLIPLIKEVASYDKEINTLAKRYFTTTQNMRAYKNALDVLGTSYEDLLYATQEDINNFTELYNLGRSLEAPAELEETLKTIRSVGQQINKLKVVSQAFFRDVIYYLGKISGKELSYWRDLLSNFVNWSATKLPIAAEFVARFLGMVMNFISSIGKFFVDLPNWIKVVSGLFLVFLSGPLGRTLAGLSLIFLLIDDFMHWKSGGKAALDWSGVYKVFENIQNTVSPIVEDIKDLGSNINSLFKDITGQDISDSWIFVLQAVLTVIQDTLLVINEYITSLKDFVAFTTPGSGAWKEWGSDVKDKLGAFDEDYWNNFKDFFSQFFIRRENSNETAYRSSSPQSANNRGYTSNTTNVAYSDVYNVNSIDEAKSLHRSNVNDIRNAYDNGLRGVFV